MRHMSELRAHARTVARKGLIGLTAIALLVPTAAVTAATPVTVIVQTRVGGMAPVIRAARDLGASVDRTGVRGLFVAELPLSAVAALEAVPSVVAVTRDRNVALASVDNAPAANDLGQLRSVASVIGADTYWNAGYTGQGVDVALIDSGVAPVRGLAIGDKLIYGPDLSFESQDPTLLHIDTFGHGTHMAGIIAGSDKNDGDAAIAAENKFVGIAPDARIVSLKVADAFGTTDVSQVIAAIGWVIRFGDRDGLNVRVINLSFGADSAIGYQHDPLAFAAERAWKKGIVVVVSGGNTETGQVGLTDPAYDPYVIAVGATVRNGTEARSDDTVGDFSRRGDGNRNPDVVAPGRSILSLRVPNSYIDQQNPGARVGDTPRLMLGTGTSQASAVVAGAAALILSKNPNLNPDKVKALLKRSAYDLGQPAAAQGAGLVDLTAAFSYGNVANYEQGWQQADAEGGLGQARGGDTIARGGERLTGSKNIFGIWIGKNAIERMLSGSADAVDELSNGQGWIKTNAWDGRQWTVGLWDGRQWTGRQWTGRQWTVGDWTGRQWTSDSWSGRQWTNAGWDGRQWTGRQWTGDEWAGDVWSTANWNS